MERMLGELQPGRNPTAIYNAHQRPGGEWLCALAIEPAVVAMVTAQIGVDAVLWNSDLVLKPRAAGRKRRFRTTRTVRTTASERRRRRACGSRWTTSMSTAGRCAWKLQAFACVAAA